MIKKNSMHQSQGPFSILFQLIVVPCEIFKKPLRHLLLHVALPVLHHQVNNIPMIESDMSDMSHTVI